MDGKQNKNLTENARKLRRNMTPQERKLWYEFLSDYPVRFRRQEVFGKYIVDFYCAKAKLIVEIDGGQHFDSNGFAYDAERTAFLETFGMKVIRFPNNDFQNYFYEICQSIDNEVKQRMNG